MHDRRSATRVPASLASRRTGADRRTRSRLRDLCDEVLASHRVARGAAMPSDDERADAHALLARVTPRLHA